MNAPTQTIGDATLVTARQVATTFKRLVGLTGYNNGADIYIQIHETAAAPDDGATPKFHFRADSASQYSFALPAPVDLSAIYVCASSTLATKTAVGGTPISIQAIVQG